MSNKSAPKFLSQAEFARRRNVSKKSVTVWKAKGLLVLNEAGQVDVEQTEWNLDQRPAKYRGGVTHRPVRAVGNGRSVLSGREGLQNGVKPDGTEPLEEPPNVDLDLTDINLPMAEAVRRKENMLGLLRRHELEVAKGEWVRIEDVALEVEREYATVRERLLTIPGKIASSLVGASQVEIETAIRSEIIEALNELHDPADIAQQVIAGGSAAGRAAGPSAAART